MPSIVRLRRDAGEISDRSCGHAITCGVIVPPPRVPILLWPGDSWSSRTRSRHVVAGLRTTAEDLTFVGSARRLQRMSQMEIERRQLEPEIPLHGPGACESIRRDGRPPAATPDFTTPQTRERLGWGTRG